MYGREFFACVKLFSKEKSSPEKKIGIVLFFLKKSAKYKAVIPTEPNGFIFGGKFFMLMMFFKAVQSAKNGMKYESSFVENDTVFGALVRPVIASGKVLWLPINIFEITQ